MVAERVVDPGQFLERSVIDGVMVFRIVGKHLRDHEKILILRRLFRHICGCARHVLLNLSGVDYVSSGVLAIVLETHKRLRQRGGRLRLCGVHPFVFEILQIVEFDQKFEILPTEEAALEQFRSEVQTYDRETIDAQTCILQ